MTKMTEIKFYVGVELNKYGVKLTNIQIAEGHEEAKKAILKKFDGYTVVEGVGVYKSGPPERTAIYTVLTENGSLRYAAESVAKELAFYFYQEAVLYTVTTIEGDMVKPEH